MKRAVFLILLVSLVLTGCTSLRESTGPTQAKTSSSNKSETDNMRKIIDDSAAGKERKKNNGHFIYGGLSSEARDIEDHLYGN
ncbi:MAG: hypothetical protein IJK97_14480 [Thermoguttaceae bacterium]|nr:hypothetical protein [Thermoguttaceae bacterium]